MLKLNRVLSPVFETSADSVRRREPLILLAVLLFAVILRLPVIMRNPIPAGDGVTSNLEVAVNLRDRYGFSTMRKWTLYSESMDELRPEGNRQPVMILLIYVLFLVTGPGFTAAQILSLFAGLICLFMCWLWARRNFGKLPALFTLLVLSVTPLFIWYSTQPDSLMLFTALFFAILLVADRKILSFKIVILLGILTGLAYLTRTQGMLLAFSIGFWVLLRGGVKRILKTLLFITVFILTCMPWFMRNLSAFGSPTYTQGGQFLLNENHWAAWEVRDTPPEPLDMLRHQGAGAVGAYLAKGTLRVLEPITTGSLHRGENFGQPSLVGFAILALLVLRSRDLRRKMILPAIASIPPMVMLVLHEHSSRYLTFFIVIVAGLGSAGLLSLIKLAGKRTATVAGVLLLLPFLYPLGSVLSEISVERAAEAEEISRWLEENSENGNWVVTYPNVGLLIWQYRRPTLTMPNDYEMLLWPCLEEHGVRYVVVDNYLPVFRPHLQHRWRRTPDGSCWQLINPPEFLMEVYRSESGKSIVYEMTEPVPEGYMHTDSLPRDNMRALSPAGIPW
ncbi:MAG: glycosyltransferase family 39 protein [Candidatus Aegiribacteria sp.]|nr:glycosyltransferase family 39 protein [Candidatus Aegiribacteria sp.]